MVQHAEGGGGGGVGHRGSDIFFVWGDKGANFVFWGDYGG